MSKAMKIGEVGVNCCADTVLRLESPSASLVSTLKGTKRKWSQSDGLLGPEDGCLLALGLGHPMTSSNSMLGSATGCTRSSLTHYALDIDLQLGNEKYLRPHKCAPVIPGPKLDLELSLSTVAAESSVTSVTLETPLSGSTAPVVDEGSTSSHWKFGNAVAQWHALEKRQSGLVGNQVPGKVSSELSPTMIVISKSSTNCASGSAKLPQRSANAKTCWFDGCGKGARGSSGFCIAHGGGRRCQKVGCNKGAEGRTVYCKAHGGGRRCQYLGCTKSAEGCTDFCIAHGGGRRCNHEGCTRAARGKSGLCIRHGGGKRCQKENCTRSAEGMSGLCISHGGGRRCQYPECTRGAQGSTMLCKAHGGGKRCTALGCTKGAEGSTPFCKGHGGGKRCSFEGGEVCPKSVHGGTLFCVAHGGGKRCAILGCTKSARGRTSFCVRHGGGKRCKFEGCEKSAQGSTDFCKAHGGGNRCTWGQSGSELGNQSAAPCDRLALGKTGFCVSHNSLLQDEQVHGGGILVPAGRAVKPSKAEKMREVVAIQDRLVNVMKLSDGGSSPQCWNGRQLELSLQLPPLARMPIRNDMLPQSVVSLPEGRVHGGKLMAMLATCSDMDPSSDNQVYIPKWP
ncbi:hypothetical protein IFM89_038508 [Coptis chinensis]|uniref:WRKY19-like zinc finger domain-containing protein n=1 Tax=Coptis chinensis TaxID=261450 RepID=A0A835IH78_9MAGN|nr:hypothetical protein IFM89_038508 [Coptis chinensis]